MYLLCSFLSSFLYFKMCSGIETECFFFFFFIRGLGWPTFFISSLSEASDEHFFSQSKDCPTQDNHCGAIRINSKYNQIYKKMLCLPSRIVGK